MRVRTILSAVVGIAVGVALAAVLGGVLVGVGYVVMQTKSNGWATLPQCGRVGINILEQAVCADPQVGLPAANLAEEATYWKTAVDGAGNKLNGQHAYTLEFPPGGLPPTSAFWSLTMYTSKFRFVSNPINRYEVSDRSGLVPNADGSVDIYIQSTPPTVHESNWLPAPTDNFLLLLRDYAPGPSVTNGTYIVPPVVEAR